MTNPTPDQIRLAREICARSAEEDGAEEYASKFRSGDIDRHPSLRSALAAIIEVTERAAGWLDTEAQRNRSQSQICRSGNAGESLRRFAQRRENDATALRNGEHLK